MLGPGGARARGRSMTGGRARSRGRGGMASTKTNVVDHRPKSLLIAGFALDEKEEVLQHFMVSTCNFRFLRTVILFGHLMLRQPNITVYQTYRATSRFQFHTLHSNLTGLSYCLLAS